jgi:hypothetical protein
MTSRARASETKKERKKKGRARAGCRAGPASPSAGRARGDDWAEPTQFGPVSPTLFFLNNFFLF